MLVNIFRATIISQVKLLLQNTNLFKSFISWIFFQCSNSDHYSPFLHTVSSGLSLSNLHFISQLKFLLNQAFKKVTVYMKS